MIGRGVVLPRMLHLPVKAAILSLMCVCLLLMTLIPCDERRLQKIGSEEIASDLREFTELQQAGIQPFIAIGHKPVLVLTYDTVTSREVSGLLTQWPDAVFVDEPLDGTYVAGWGIKPGSSQRSQILSYSNGSIRIPSDEEFDSTVETLDRVFNGQFGRLKLPTILFVWRQTHKVFTNFTQCMRDHELMPSTIIKCQKRIRQWCPAFSNFDQPQDAHECFLKLASYQGQSHGNSSERGTPSLQIEYEACMHKVMDTADLCMPKLRPAWLNRTLRFISTRLLPLEYSEYLLKTKDNFRILNVMRDPRAVLCDTKRTMGTALKSRQWTLAWARHVCQNMMSDILMSAQLSKRYPGRIKQVLYSDLVHRTGSVLADLHVFLDTRRSKDFVGATQFQNRPSSRCDDEAKRSTVFTARETDTIEEECRAVIHHINSMSSR